MTETAPYVGVSDQGLGGDSGPIAWQIAHPVLQDKLWQYYGDRRMIERARSNITEEETLPS